MIKTSWIVAKGIAMGAADVVPGVSGGTIALLTGIYPRLITAITNINLKTVLMLFKGQFQGFWSAVDGRFILPLLCGIILAFALLSHSIKHAIEHYPIETWSFFFGLIVASAILIIKNIPNKRISHYMWLIPGLICGFWISSLTSIPFPNNQIAFFIAGMIAICAMILPGISGSFILLLLGMYQPLITAVTEKQWIIIVIFGCGAIIGLLVFSRIIKWVLKYYYQITLFFLSGLMLGSLTKVWPWKNNIDSITQNILPTMHSEPQTMTAISMAITAIIIVFFVDFLGQKLKTIA